MLSGVKRFLAVAEFNEPRRIARAVEGRCWTFRIDKALRRAEDFLVGDRENFERVYALSRRFVFTFSVF